MTDDDSSTRSVASVASVGHTGEAHYYLAAAACATAFIWVQAKLVQQVLSNPQPRRSFTPCGHPSGKRLSARCSRKRNPSNGSTAGGQPAGVFWFYGRPPRIRWVASPPVSPFCYDWLKSFFDFLATKNVPYPTGAVHFFCLFLVNSCQKNSFHRLFRCLLFVTPHALRRGNFYYE